MSQSHPSSRGHHVQTPYTYPSQYNRSTTCSATWIGSHATGVVCESGMLMVTLVLEEGDGVTETVALANATAKYAKTEIAPTRSRGGDGAPSSRKSYNSRPSKHTSCRFVRFQCNFHYDRPTVTKKGDNHDIFVPRSRLFPAGVSNVAFPGMSTVGKTVSSSILPFMVDVVDDRITETCVIF